MLIAFVWFTIGTTYVVVEQLKQSNIIAATKDFNTDSENTPDPFANATEEKGENSWLEQLQKKIKKLNL